MTEKEKAVLDLIKDYKFKGYPSINVCECPLPDITALNSDTVHFPRRSWNQYRDSYLLLCKFILLITKGEVTTDSDMFRLLMDEAAGKIEIVIKINKDKFSHE